MRSAWISFTRKDFDNLSSDEERGSSGRQNQVSVERFGKLLKALLSENALRLVESQIAQVTFCAVMSYARFCPRDFGVCMFAK